MTKSRLIGTWTDPQSGVVSHILTPPEGDIARVAPLQQSFYYINQSLSADGRYYWFYCAFPPSNDAHTGRCLGLADFQEESIRWFPETAFSAASPYVYPATADVYWANAQGVWTLSVDPQSSPRRMGGFAVSQVGNRPIKRYATHFTRSPDGKYFGIDAGVGGDTVIGKFSLEQGQVETWQTVQRIYNHGQFNPVHPDLMLLAQENYVNPISGEYIPKDNRLWLIRKGGQLTPVYPESLASEGYEKTSANSHLVDPVDCVRKDPRQLHGHEWWSADGEYIWYIHYQTGVERVPLSVAGPTEAQPELMWPHETVSHAHSSPCGNYLVLDSMPADAPECHHVRFVNLKTQRSVDIVSHMPQASKALHPYHMHPHPHFCVGGHYVCYSTTVHGAADVAFVRVADLLAATE
ncbi:hypothetical protein SH580_05205 [Coraliomargarita algicola]|uniref:Glycosyl hydrolase family 43 n=1 Tax=Coraliomargarita algicola TaxID=3092156 RepID=A0ABZ0RPR8_9BACT|nr:hypothetical protein [Coraliomargarita sp. J2-16]WPJ97103.1 hypothetical protein SH580_05205 [Coraliomargarita sp. J2-16]